MARIRKNVSMIEGKDKAQSETWDFEVMQEELLTSKGVKSGIHAVVRQDTDEVIGQYKGVKALAYKSLVETFETALVASGHSFTNSFLTTNNGSRFFGRYNIGNGIDVGTDSFNKIIRLQSSHDGSLTPGFNLEIERLICLNGMIGLAKVFSLFKKHSENFDMGFISANISNAITSGEKYAIETIERMGNIALNDGQARNVLSNIVTMGKNAGLSERTGYLIHNNWVKPSNDEVSLGNTLYRLYNAATRFTRDVNNVGRFELSRRANIFITGAFDLATRNETNLSRLLGVPSRSLEFDSITVNN